jgi:AraC family transcriptional regulator
VGRGFRVERNLLRLVKNRVHDSAGADINLTDLARECGVSVRHLSRMFIEATGVTPAVYVANVRIQKAKTALTDGVMPIKQIAHNCGFRSVSAFTAAFRRETGVTPGNYRRFATN